MADQATPSRPFIESDRVEGAPVYGANDGYIGTIKRLIIEKTSGRIVYAVVAIGGFLGLGQESHTVPWGALRYETKLGGYRTEITESELRDAPDFSREGEFAAHDPSRERALHDHYRQAPYWVSDT
jgi:hypothetical protein